MTDSISLCWTHGPSWPQCIGSTPQLNQQFLKHFHAPASATFLQLFFISYQYRTHLFRQSKNLDNDTSVKLIVRRHVLLRLAFVFVFYNKPLRTHRRRESEVFSRRTPLTGEHFFNNVRDLCRTLLRDTKQYIWGLTHTAYKGIHTIQSLCRASV